MRLWRQTTAAVSQPAWRPIISTRQTVGFSTPKDSLSRIISFKLAAIFMAADEGKTGMMITLDRNGDDPYQCGTSAYDIHAIANVERPPLCPPAEISHRNGINLFPFMPM